MNTKCWGRWLGAPTGGVLGSLFHLQTLITPLSPGTPITPLCWDQAVSPLGWDWGNKSHSRFGDGGCPHPLSLKKSICIPPRPNLYRVTIGALYDPSFSSV